MKKERIEIRAKRKQKKEKEQNHRNRIEEKRKESTKEWKGEQEVSLETYQKEEV